MTNLQRGIAIAPILFVVAILAVLAVAIAAGSGAFSGDTSAVSAKAQAAAILEYANEVKFAVDRVLGKGCLDTQISFENPIVSGYTNPNAPSDKSCHVFDVNGGGIVLKKYSFFGSFGFYTCGAANTALNGVGSSQCDLYMIFRGLNLSICQEVNKLIGISGIPDEGGGSYGNAQFVGTYIYSTSGVEPLNSSIFKGKSAYCVVSGYSFVFVLIAR